MYTKEQLHTIMNDLESLIFIELQNIVLSNIGQKKEYDGFTWVRMPLIAHLEKKIGENKSKLSRTIKNMESNNFVYSRHFPPHTELRTKWYTYNHKISIQIEGTKQYCNLSPVNDKKDILYHVKKSTMDAPQNAKMQLGSQSHFPEDIELYQKLFNLVIKGILFGVLIGIYKNKIKKYKNNINNDVLKTKTATDRKTAGKKQKQQVATAQQHTAASTPTVPLPHSDTELTLEYVKTLDSDARLEGGILYKLLMSGQLDTLTPEEYQELFGIQLPKLEGHKLIKFFQVLRNFNTLFPSKKTILRKAQVLSILHAFRNGHTVEEIDQAFKGRIRDDWWVSRKKHTDFPSMFRDRSSSGNDVDYIEHFSQIEHSHNDNKLEADIEEAKTKLEMKGRAMKEQWQVSEERLYEIVEGKNALTLDGFTYKPQTLEHVDALNDLTQFRQLARNYYQLLYQRK